MKPSAAAFAFSSTSASRERGTIMRVERRAGLARVEVAGEQPGRHGRVEIGVLQDDVGRFPAELEGDLLHGLGGQRHDPLAGPGRPGERHHVDLGMARDRLADHRSDAGHQIEDAGGNPTSSRTSASANAFSGATSLGLRTTVQPAASAGATFSAIW